VGHYSLLIPTDLAKCLWKEGATQANLILSVVNSDGSKQIATTTVSVDRDWFKFNAAGFHFSAPKLVASAVKKVSTPSQNSAVEKKIPTTKKITCKKGSAIKKFSGVKCPVGYKKVP
jgi:hypothetical protein